MTDAIVQKPAEPGQAPTRATLTEVDAVLRELGINAELLVTESAELLALVREDAAQTRGLRALVTSIVRALRGPRMRQLGRDMATAALAQAQLAGTEPAPAPTDADLDWAQAEVGRELEPDDLLAIAAGYRERLREGGAQ